MIARIWKPLYRLWADESGSNAIEFAILASPFLLLLLGVVQLGIYFVAQAALDTGVTRTAESLRAAFYNSATTTFPNAATLKSRVRSYSGGLVESGASLAVEIRPLTSLTSAIVPIADATNSYGTNTSVLALRATNSVSSFIPGVPVWRVSSMALVRRQGR